MAALSRNTASVAQDFHNAGGGVKTTFHKNYTMDELCKSTLITNQQHQTTIAKQQQKYSNNKMASNNVSPPANLKITNHSTTVTKKRRKISQEKENENINLLCEYFDANKLMQRFNNVNQTFHSDNKNFIQQQQLSFPDIQIANESIWFEPKISEKRNRKQSQPRKIEKNIVAVPPPIEEKSKCYNNKLLDKHLLKMVSKKKRCNICEHKKQFMIMPYHKKSSLILHNLWRHTFLKYNCKHPKCGQKFNMKYKLKMHLKIMHK